MSNRTEQQIMLAWGQAREPVVSITCPAYNQRAWIAQTLDSFLSQQTSFPFEILINDDASHDGTTEIIAEYALRYPNLIRPVFHEQNQYQQGKYCFPALFNMARGRYIAYCDGDDYWCDRTKLQQQVDFLEANPDYVLTYHDALVVDQHGTHGLQIDKAQRCDATGMDLLKGRRISTLTAVFRNVLGVLPKELEHAPMLDLCWWSLLGTHGKGKFMEGIQPGGYRRHDGGIFSMRSNKRKIHMSLQTHMALANYYHNQGDQLLYEHYLVQVFGLSLAAISPGQKLLAVGLMLRNVTRNLFRRLHLRAARS